MRDKNTHNARCAHERMREMVSDRKRRIWMRTVGKSRFAIDIQMGSNGRAISTKLVHSIWFNSIGNDSGFESVPNSQPVSWLKVLSSFIFYFALYVSSLLLVFCFLKANHINGNGNSKWNISSTSSSSYANLNRRDVRRRAHAPIIFNKIIIITNRLTGKSGTCCNNFHHFVWRVIDWNRSINTIQCSHFGPISSSQFGCSENNNSNKNNNKTKHFARAHTKLTQFISFSLVRFDLVAFEWKWADMNWVEMLVLLLRMQIASD